MGRGPGKGPLKVRDIIPECERRHADHLKEGSRTQALTKRDLIERLRNVELKVMTWNLADFSTTGVVQSRLWNKVEDTKPRNTKSSRGSANDRGRVSGGIAPETPPCSGRLTLVADTIADEGPDVVFIQEVTTNEKNTALEELTEELKERIKSRELDVWIDGKAAKFPGHEADITYEHTLSNKLKNEGPGGERYGCIWNTSKFKRSPEVSYLETAEHVGEFGKILGVVDVWENIKSDFEVLERCGGFSRFPALFTFTPKYGGPTVDNKTEEKIHFLVFHLASSNPKYGGPARNKAEMRVLRSLAIHAWKAGSRLILLGDHNAGECGTVPVLNTFLKDEREQVTGRFAVDTKGPESSTNLFPFIKGSASNASKSVTNTVKEYLAFLEEQNVNLKDENLLEYVGDAPKLRDGKLKKKLEEIMYELGFSDFIHSSGAKHNDNIIFPPDTLCRSSADARNNPVGETVDAYLNFLEERGVQLRIRNEQTRKYKEKYKLQYDSDEELKTDDGMKEALKKIIDDEYFTVDPRRKYVYDLHFLEARVLEVPAQKLLDYTIEHNEPFGSWKYLWSDHRPVVARFTLT